MLQKMRRFAKRLHQDDSGAMSVEKILIIGLIALPILITLLVFKDKITGWFESNAGDLEDYAP